MKAIILLLMLMIFAILVMMSGCEKKNKIHTYATDPPNRFADYLTYVEFEKILHTDTGILDTQSYFRWEVLQFNPGFDGDHRWNTLHFDQPLGSRVEINYDILFWTELPNDPIGTSFEPMSGGINPPTK